jgi:hypothetical protein
MKKIEVGTKKLGVGKEKDLVELQVEYLKWGSKTLAPHIIKIFNNIIQQGFPTDWTTILAIPLFKSGDINNPPNYRTIIISPLFAKLFGSMLENRINKWAEEGDKRAKGKAGFRPKHSTIDHGITLRHIIEKVWEKKEEAFCCFIDFIKTFDMVPRESLAYIEWRNLGFLYILEKSSMGFMRRLNSKLERQLVSPKVLGVILGSSKGAHCPLPFLAYIFTNLKSG